jgi:uncharacterized protein YggU (UPF0235/DUF167 family)
MPVLSERDNGVVVEIAVRPRAGRCRVAGLSGERLKVEVTSAPEGGAATEQALATLAAAAGLRASHAVLLKGLRERHKTVLLEGISLAECRTRLGIGE